MSNIIDYMKWRGDLTFAQDSFNEIDNLILSQLVYVELNNIVPGDEEPTISLLDAAKLFFKQNNEQELLDHVSMTKNAILVFKEMAKSVRFKNVQLSRYVNDINEQEQSQFSAITIKLPDTGTGKITGLFKCPWESGHSASSGRTFQRWKLRYLCWNVLRKISA